MGWAKYFEDDMSICNNRMYLRNCAVEQLEACEPRAAAIKMQVTDNAAAARKVVQNTDGALGTRTRAKRSGLELRFPACPEKALMNKLRLNGWWWSNSANSWCNTDSEANRRYAKEALKKWNPVILRTAC